MSENFNAIGLYPKTRAADAIGEQGKYPKLLKHIPQSTVWKQPNVLSICKSKGLSFTGT